MPSAELFTHWLHQLELLLPTVVMILIIFAALGAIIVQLLILADMVRLAKLKQVFIELTPPTQTDKTATATQRMFTVMHGMESSRSFIDKLLRRRIIFTREIVATREQGIRYVVRVSERDVDAYEHTIASYLPEVKYRRIDDYTPHAASSSRVRVLSFRQTGHFAYPLQTQLFLDDHDPAGYINGGKIMKVQTIKNDPADRSDEAKIEFENGLRSIWLGMRDSARFAVNPAARSAGGCD